MIGNKDGRTTPRSPAPTTEEAKDDLLSTLAHPVRRRALSALESETGRVAVTDLARRIDDRTPSDGPTGGDESERLALALHHNHLPRLSAVGLIEYDADRNAVTATDEALLGACLDAVERFEP